MTVTPPDWSAIDTVFLDMDGTLLDLHFDNQVWNHEVPRAYVDAQGLGYDMAREQLLEHMREIHGTIEFYSFEYWNAYTGLDLTDLHVKHATLVSYRPGALDFLRWLRLQDDKTTIIATNAHRHSIAVKDAQLNVSAEVTGVVSSHDFQAPKESLEYWQAMQQVHPFDPARAIFIDDNEPVLDHARAVGIQHLWTVSTPDSKRPQKAPLSYPCFSSFDELRPA